MKSTGKMTAGTGKTLLKSKKKRGKTMTSKDILFCAGRNDECYTPAYAVFPILKYIPEGLSIKESA